MLKKIALAIALTVSLSACTGVQVTSEQEKICDATLHGIGMNFAFDARDKTLFVVRVFPGSSSDRVGIRARDRISTFNGVAVSSFSSKAVVEETFVRIAKDAKNVPLTIRTKGEPVRQVAVTAGKHCDDGTHAFVAIPTEGDEEPSIIHVFDAKRFIEDVRTEPQPKTKE